MTVAARPVRTPYGNEVSTPPLSLNNLCWQVSLLITRLLEDYWIGRRAQVQVDCAGVSAQVNALDVAVVPLVQCAVGWRGALVLADCAVTGSKELVEGQVQNVVSQPVVAEWGRSLGLSRPLVRKCRESLVLGVFSLPLASNPKLLDVLTAHVLDSWVFVPAHRDAVFRVAEPLLALPLGGTILVRDRR